MPSSSCASIFCLTCPHAVYNKQKKGQLYPVSEKTKGKEEKQSKTQKAKRLWTAQTFWLSVHMFK